MSCPHSEQISRALLGLPRETLARLACIPCPALRDAVYEASDRLSGINMTIPDRVRSAKKIG